MESMSGGHIPLPPPPVDPTGTTVPPSHEAVIDLQAKHTTSNMTVELVNGRTVVTVHGSQAAGVPLPEGNEHLVRKSEADSDTEQLPE